MIHQILSITIKELKVLLLDREALALLFIMPIFFILVMSFALEGVFEAGSERHPIKILVASPPGCRWAGEILEDLRKIEGLVLIETHQGEPLTPERAEELIQKRAYPLALLFPEGWTQKGGGPGAGSKEGQAIVYLMSDPAMNFQLLAAVKGAIAGVIEKRTFMASSSHLGNPLLVPPAQEEPSPQVETGLQGKSKVELVHTFPRHYHRERRPSATEQNVPAYTIFGVFFIVLTLASSFLKEKQDGTFQRILAAPLSKTALLIGKLLPYYLVNLIQIALMFSIGVLVFKMQLGSLPALIIVSLALALSANGLGLLVAALGRTEAQVNGLSVLLAVTLSALGGLMVPSFVMPEWMRTLSLFTPHAWALTGYHDVIIRGLGVNGILCEMLILLGFALGFFGIALWRFRFNG